MAQLSGAPPTAASSPSNRPAPARLSRQSEADRPASPPPARESSAFPCRFWLRPLVATSERVRRRRPSNRNFGTPLRGTGSTSASPFPLPALRVGVGFVQDAQDAANGTDYSIAVPDAAGTGYVVGGLLLVKYRSLGGVTGSLGYPSSDATAGGRQLFAGPAALAGNPAHLVT